MAARQIIIIACINVFFLDFTTFALKCFQCQHSAKPYDCGNITECSPDEYCFIRQSVTASGNIVYDSGCISKAGCPSSAQQMVGKRSFHIAHKRQDLDICFHCCIDDFCNRQGCGVQDLPLGQRGPYCFNCNSMPDPTSCRSVSLCDQDENCILYSEDKSGSLLHLNIKSSCAKQLKCEAVLQTSSNVLCAPNCCKTDFCNVHCGSRQSLTVTTQVPKTTKSPSELTKSTGASTVSIDFLNTSSKRFTLYTTSKPFHCDTSGGYVHLHTWNVQLCVHMVHRHKTWQDARAACRNEGGDLVVLDTLDKAMLLRNELVANYPHSGYWIGAKDFHDDNIFEWVNDHQIHHVNPLEAEWDVGQPNHFHHDERQNCVGMLSDNFRWHDINCDHSFNYICEH